MTTETVAPTPKTTGLKVLLQGSAGTGKTYSIGTLCEWAEEHNHKVCILMLETSIDVIQGYFADRKRPVPDCVYWHTQLTKTMTLAQLAKVSKNIGNLDFKGLSNMTDNARGQNNAFLEIVNSLANFVDDRTGTILGAADSWDSSYILVIDSLSSLSNAAMKMVVGANPTASMSDYMVAGGTLLNLLTMLTQSLAAHLVMTGHTSREVNELTGTERIAIASIGKALTPKIPMLFGEVIGTQRKNTTYTWDTADSLCDVKSRTRGPKANMPADFRPLMDAWLAVAKGV